MLGHTVARQPAPMLAMRGIGLRLRHGPTAFGNALGSAIGEALAPAPAQMTQDDFRRSEIQQVNADAMIQQGIDQSDAMQRQRFAELDANNAATASPDSPVAYSGASNGYNMDAYGVSDKLASKPGVRFRVGNPNAQPAAVESDGPTLKMDLGDLGPRRAALTPASAAGAPAFTHPTYSPLFSDNETLTVGNQTAINILAGATEANMRLAQDPNQNIFVQFMAQQSAGQTGYMTGMAQAAPTSWFGLTMDLAGVVPIVGVEAKLNVLEKLAQFGPEVSESPFLSDMAISSGGGREFARSPGQIKWVDENVGMNDAARAYNDGAAGARSNLATEQSMAPAIYRSTPDGVGTIVKFDGVEDGVLIDRKVSVVTTDKAKDQALRQSQALTENGLTARWEVPTQAQANRAEKMFLELDIKNITTKVVPKNGTP